jgi:hypothetical protein
VKIREVKENSSDTIVTLTNGGNSRKDVYKFLFSDMNRAIGIITQ